MLEYGAYKEPLDFLNLEENPKIQWTDSIGWAMAQHMITWSGESMVRWLKNGV
jgi:hypothetical protein